MVQTGRNGMDARRTLRYFPAMNSKQIPTWQLYDEVNAFPDILHLEQVVGRAAGLDWTIGPHRHLHLHQLFLLTSGDIRLTLNHVPQTVIPPVVINIPRGTVHSFSFSAGTEGYVVTLPADDFRELFTAPALSHRFEALAAAHAGNVAFRRTLLRAEAAALVAQVIEKDVEIYAGQTLMDPRIQRFAAMVRDQMTRRFSLNALAEAFALSPRHLSRLCKAETGMTAQSYFETQKMREACRLLVYTRMSVQQIAFHLGFDDPAYFSRAVQRNLHLSPSAYRARFER